MSNEMKEQLKMLNNKYTEKCLEQKNKNIIYDAIRRINKRIQGDIRVV